jgi:hypothetical protein
VATFSGVTDALAHPATTTAKNKARRDKRGEEQNFIQTILGATNLQSS